MTSEFIEPSAHSRRNLLVLFAGIIAAAAFIRFYLLPAFFAFVAALPPCEQVRWLQGVLLASLGPLPVFAVWALLHARQLLKFKRSPLPNAWVLRRTRVRRARSVRWQAYGLIVCGAVALVAPVWAWQTLESVGLMGSSEQCSPAPSSARAAPGQPASAARNLWSRPAKTS